MGSIYFFHPVYGPTITHEHQGYHIDLKDCPAVTFHLIGGVVNKGPQANVLAVEEKNYGFYHEGQYSQRTLSAKE